MSKHSRFKQSASLEARLSDEAQALRKQAESLPPGPDREAMLRKARQDETTAHLTAWLLSPGLRPLKIPSTSVRPSSARRQHSEIYEGDA